MPYATAQDLIERYGEDELIQLTDRADPPAGAVDVAIADKALADACELIDAYCAGRYRVPLDPAPGIVTRLACDVARFLLHEERPTEAVKEAHAAALKLLRDIAGGIVKLQAAGVEAPGAAAGEVATAGPGRIFSSDSLTGF